MKSSRTFLNAVFAATAVLSAPAANAQVVTTFAGSGAAGSSDGKAAQASFSYPAGLAVDASNIVYVADRNNQTIRKIAPDGTVSTLAGSGSKGSVDGNGTAASFRFPIGIAVDAAFSVYVVEESSWACCGAGSDADVRKIAPNGDVTTLVSLGRYVMSVSAAIIDGNGDLFVADQADFGDGVAGKILKVTGAASITTITGKGTPFQVKGPSAIGVDSVGNLTVADSYDGTLTRLAPDGSSTVLATGIANAGGLAVDGAGIVYVAETIRNRILRIARDGSVTVVAGSETAGSSDGTGVAASFNSPRSLALDRAGNLFVADTGNNLIRKITLTDACAPGCGTWTIPSAAHSVGAGGSFWTSDLTVHNRGSAQVAMTLKFLGQGADGTPGPEIHLTLDPHRTVTYPDVLLSVFGIAEGWGAVQVLTSSRDVTVRSRTSTLRAGGTIGDGAPGVRQSSFITDQTSPSPVLTGLREDDRFRSNLVLVNGTTAPLDILVAASDSTGASVGSKTYTLPPLGMIQDSRFLMGAEFGAQSRTDVTVTLSSSTPGAAFTASAVVIDNASNAPTTVLPQ